MIGVSKVTYLSFDTDTEWRSNTMFGSIGFIGTGTMGSAVARAAVKGAPEASILLANRTPAKAEALAQALGCQVSDNETVARTCSLIFLGVKPQMMGKLLESLAPIRNS